MIELAQPVSEGSRLAADLAAHGELPHSATFRVRDLAAAEHHVEKVGVRVAERDSTPLTLEPADCFGAVWSFTERDLPGDPRGTRPAVAGCRTPTLVEHGGLSMLFIDGSWVPAASGATFESRNPATGEVLGEVADGGAEDAERRGDAPPRAAFRSWSKLTPYQRSAHLYDAWRIMTERREELARLMTSEQGKPLRMARNEVGYAADFLLWFAEEAKRVYGATIPSARADQRFLTMYQPVGVAAAITPWNYPISMLTRKIAPALAAGCTIVVKPAEQTPLCAVETIKVFEDGRSPGRGGQPGHHQRSRPGGR